MTDEREKPRETGAWQYTSAVVGGSYKDLVVQMNAMGARRWEVIHVDKQAGFQLVLFKRPAFEGAEPHHLYHDIIGAGPLDDQPPPVEPLPDADKRDADRNPLPPPQPEPTGFAAHVEAEQHVVAQHDNRQGD